MNAYRDTPDAPAAPGPGVIFRDVVRELSRPRRTSTFSRTLSGGLCHAFLGRPHDLFGYVAGLQRPKQGTVTITGGQRAATYRPGGRSPRPWLHRLLPSLAPTDVVRLERTLERAWLCVVDQPFTDVPPEDHPRVVAAIRGAVARGATLLVSVATISEALRIGDVFHVFAQDGEPRGHGDVEAVFRPDVGGAPAPDQIVNHLGSWPVADFDGVEVAVEPHESWSSMTSVDAHGKVSGAIQTLVSAHFTVPAGRIVVEPAFTHGAPSGSPDRRWPEKPLTEPGPPGWAPRPHPIDRTARYVVLDTTVEDSYRIGRFMRLVVASSRGHRFHADIPKDAPLPSRVRIGFDSANVES